MVCLTNENLCVQARVHWDRHRNLHLLATIILAAFPSDYLVLTKACGARCVYIQALDNPLSAVSTPILNLQALQKVIVESVNDTKY